MVGKKLKAGVASEEYQTCGKKSFGIKYACSGVLTQKANVIIPSLLLQCFSM